jgi:hypothetical protein
MKVEVQKAADLTISRLQLPSKVTLPEAAKLVREFLVALKPTLSAWKPWLKVAVSIVISILGVLIGDEEMDA